MDLEMRIESPRERKKENRKKEEKKEKKEKNNGRLVDMISCLGLRSCSNLSHVANVQRGPLLPNLTISLSLFLSFFLLSSFLNTSSILVFSLEIGTNFLLSLSRSALYLLFFLLTPPNAFVFFFFFIYLGILEQTITATPEFLGLRSSHTLRQNE